VLVEVRDPAGVLLAGCLADRLSDGLSAVYSFYDAGSGYKSLGAFMILWLIEQVRREGRAFVYLGYWIANSQKMAYKALFKPLEIYSADGWHRLPDGAAAG
jgi:arginine-tRNA-protein transferase